MPSEILIHAGAGETRAALVTGGRLEAYAAASLLGPRAARRGDIYLGRVVKMVDAIEAAFVEIGHGQPGFLARKDVLRGIRLHEGAALPVTVIREAMGEKGARLSAKVSAALPAGARPPALLTPGPDLAERVVRDWAGKDTPVAIDDARAAAALRSVFPGHVIERVREDLFARHDLEDQIAGLMVPRVMLPSGGFLTIEKTRALTAIDIDSGGFQAAGGRTETARAVNREAAREAGRQIRLRGIGGVIAIDFIQTDDLPVAILRESLGDAVPVEIVPVPALCLVTVARKHEGPSPVTGDAAEMTARAVLRQLERSARAAPGRRLTVRAAPRVTALLDGAAVRAGLDRRGVGPVDYVAEAGREGDFDVATG